MQGIADNVTGKRHFGFAELACRVLQFDVLDWIFHIEPESAEEEDPEELYRILEEAGIDSFAYEYMDDDEKADVLEEAGLDPYDFGL